jgi:type IV pilus assembly protein PilE
MRPSKRIKGFTLIELMISVAIVGILAGIAYPSYISHVTKSRRADATVALLGLANAMERRYTETNSYCDAGGTGGEDTCGTADTNDTGSPSIYSAQSPIDGGTKYYDLTIYSVTDNTYTLVANPINSQAGDGMLQLSHTGERSWDQNNDGDVEDEGENIWK